MAISPAQESSATIVILVKVNGIAISDTCNIQSINVQHAINQISAAELVIPGVWDPATGQSVSPNEDFLPGNLVEIFAGYSEDITSCLFKGTLIRQRLKVNGSGQSTLTLTCKHAADSMTYQETNRYFEKKTDEEIIKNILAEYGLNNQTGNCATFQESYFQSNTTDWDTIVALSNSNGCIVTLDTHEAITIASPSFSGSAALCIEAGVSLFDFEGTVDAASQPSELTLSAWDPIQMIPIDARATEPALNQQGSLTAKDLSSALFHAPVQTNTATSPNPTALQARADAVLLQKRLAAFTGKISFAGNALAKTGTIINIKGVGKLLSGDAFVSAVTHTLEAGNWETNVCFGLEQIPKTISPRTVTYGEHKQLQSGPGLQLGTVLRIEGDAEQLYRIQVELPYNAYPAKIIWARMAHSQASNQAGAFFLPEIGDEVVIGYLENDASYPVILGSLYNGKYAPPYTPEAENNIKAFVTRSKMKMVFDEEKKSISLLTPAKNTITLNDDGKCIEIKDMHNNSLLLGPDGITLNSIKDIKISAKGKISIDGDTAIAVTAKADLTLEGMNVKAEAMAGFTGKGSASAELSAAGQTTVKGAMVMIN